MLKVIKRDGRIQEFSFEKMQGSIKKASDSCKVGLDDEQYKNINLKVAELLEHVKEINVEKLQELIEKALYICGNRKVREAYKDYRMERTNIRETKSDIMNVIKKLGGATDRDNANVGNNFSAKLLRIASESNKWQVLANMPKELAKEHESLDLYIHD